MRGWTLEHRCKCEIEDKLDFERHMLVQHSEYKISWQNDTYVSMPVCRRAVCLTRHMNYTGRCYSAQKKKNDDNGKVSQKKNSNNLVL